MTHRALEPNEFSLLETPVIEKGRGSSTKEFALFQNTPNPFNSSTKIHYSIAEPSHVTLVVYNLQGQRVAKLQNGVQPAADYRVTFDALDLQSGVYFYSLEIGTGFVSTMMMTLIK